MIIFSFLTFYRNQFKKTEILNALSSDHSPVFCSFVNNDIFARGSGVWKFNNALLLNTEFAKKLKTHIKTVTSNLQENSYFSDHSKWEFLKFEILKFSISFSKNFAKKERIIQTNLENRIKTLEQSLKNEEDFNAYNLCKLELENMIKRQKVQNSVANVNGINMEKNRQSSF